MEHILQHTPYEILERVSCLGLINLKKRKRIALAILKENDCICGIRWTPRRRKYEIYGLNFIENGNYREIYNNSLRSI